MSIERQRTALQADPSIGTMNLERAGWSSISSSGGEGRGEEATMDFSAVSLNLWGGSWKASFLLGACIGTMKLGSRTFADQRPSLFPLPAGERQREVGVFTRSLKDVD